jgi:hypothetical protein
MHPSPRSPRSFRVSRSIALIRIQRELEYSAYPRIEMGIFVALTGAAGWVASALLLHWGMLRMATRYPVALGLAYLVFLALLWLWLRTTASEYPNAPDISDATDVADILHSTLPSRRLSSGAQQPAAVQDEPTELSSLGDSAQSASDALGSVGDADEFAIPLLAILLAAGLALASLYVVYMAPALFAELLLDGVLSYSLYRHLRRGDSAHWLNTAVRRTLLPFALTAVFVALVGAGLAAYAPGTHTLGQALHAAGR